MTILAFACVRGTSRIASDACYIIRRIRNGAWIDRGISITGRVRKVVRHA